MPNTLDHLFAKNRAWADRIVQRDPQFFEKLSGQQAPKYLWIGCSDSRVPANELVDLMPGEMFVHRNIANVVVHSDLNCLSVMQFAVDVLKVRHIMVVGHYGCGGVLAALRRDRVGLADNWLGHLHDVRMKHAKMIENLADQETAHARLCELNVIEQVASVCQTTICRDAWDRKQELTVHGWIYGVRNGLLRDLNFTVDNPSDEEASYQLALASLV